MIRSISLRLVVILLQLPSFWLLVRGLDKAAYGIYSAALAGAVIVIHFVSPGFTNLIVSYGSRGKREEVDQIYTIGLITASVVSLPLIHMICKVVGGEFSVWSWAIYLLVFSEVLLMRIFDFLASYVHFRNPWRYFYIHFLYTVLKFSVVVAWYYRSGKGAELLFTLMFLVNVLACLMMWAYVKPRFKRVWFKGVALRRYVKEGTPYAVNVSCRNINTSFDKVLINSLYGGAINADYSLASRFVYIAFLPFHTYVMMKIPRMFANGHAGIAVLYDQTKRSFYTLVVLAFLCCLGIYLFSPVVSRLFGTQYDSAVAIVRVMSFYPIVLFFEMYFAELMTCSGANLTRMRYHIASAVVCVLACYILIPRYGVYGGALSFFVAETVLIACLLGYTVRRLGDRDEGAPFWSGFFPSISLSLRFWR